MTHPPENREIAEDLAEDLRTALVRAYDDVATDPAALAAVVASSRGSLHWADHADPNSPAYIQGVRAFGGADDLAPLVYAAMAGLLVLQRASQAVHLLDRLEEVAAAELAAI